jgi:transmembrane sensor
LPIVEAEPEEESGSWLRTGGTRVFALAASLAAVVGVGALTYGVLLKSTGGTAIALENRTIATGRGQHHAERLKDGSQVTLGAQTRMAVALTPGGRDVSLESGQMFVEVAPDRRRPFVVRTRYSSVTAIGTAFDVDLRKRGIAVSVFHGTVLVKATQPGDEGSTPAVAYVHAGQGLVVSDKGFRLLPGAVSAGTTPAWTKGRLEYRNVALSSVLQDVNRYAETPIVTADEATGELRYTGSVDVAHIRPWLAGVAQAFDLGTGTENGAVTLRQKKSAR